MYSGIIVHTFAVHKEMKQLPEKTKPGLLFPRQHNR